MTDPREAAARYRQERLQSETGDAAAAPPGEDAASDQAVRAPGERERAAYVETAIQQAIRRGDFDGLPGAGKPLRGLGASHDPDWWIKRKIEAEGLTGLGPPALTLRTEYAGLDDEIDALHSESLVREHLDDFNRRVVEARRQLLGGPPVVTPTVDVDERVEEWRQRRDAAARAAAEEHRRAHEQRPPSWIDRWRRGRGIRSAG